MHPLLEQFIDFAQKENITESAFIVGGAVRDILLSKEIKDTDLAIKGDALKIAEEFARYINASFVLLDKEFGIARVVKNSQFLDFAALKGDSIYTDLSDRDITINAMALPLTACQTSESLIDPHNGKNDLSQKIVRMVSEENLIKDPLRILRAYRFSSTLNFSIERNTRGALIKYGSLLKSVAAERIAGELRHILRIETSHETLESMGHDSVLSSILPEITGLNDERWKHTLMLYRNLEDVLSNTSIYFLNYYESVSRYFEIDYRKICLKLSALFHDTEIGEKAALRLKMSNKEVEFIYKVFLNQQQILNLFAKKERNKKETVMLLKEFRDDVYPLMILSIAAELSFCAKDSSALSYPIRSFCNEILTLYHTEFKKRTTLLPLITGDDLIKEFGLKPSPLFKKILSQVDDMVLEGKIISKEEALKAVSKML